MNLCFYFDLTNTLYQYNKPGMFPILTKFIIILKKGYLKNSSICFVRKFGLSSGMKCPVFGNVIPVTLFATF